LYQINLLAWIKPMSTQAKLVMFDLDGTLVETGNEIAHAVNDTLSEFDFAHVTQEQVNGWIGFGTLELLIQALAFATQTDIETTRGRNDLTEIKKQFDLNYQHRCGTICRLYPQVREVLTQLKAQGVKLAVVTNKEMRYTRTVLEAHQLCELFDAVIGGDSFPAKKPDPAGVNHCLRLFGVDPDDALFVGDSSIDAATARNAGVKVWLLTYGYNMHQPVTACAPDRVIDNVSALV
jgi:phosphoglycolate phosphatase